MTFCAGSLHVDRAELRTTFGHRDSRVGSTSAPVDAAYLVYARRGFVHLAGLDAPVASALWELLQAVSHRAAAIRVGSRGPHGSEILPPP
jgi:hypothetical protein